MRRRIDRRPSGCADDARGRREPGRRRSPPRSTSCPRWMSRAIDALLGELHGTPVVVNFWASVVPALPGGGAAARHGRRRRSATGCSSSGSTSSTIATEAPGVHRRVTVVTYPSVFDPVGSIRTDLGQYRAARDGLLRRRRAPWSPRSTGEISREASGREPRRRSRPEVRRAGRLVASFGYGSRL